MYQICNERDYAKVNVKSIAIIAIIFSLLSVSISLFLLGEKLLDPELPPGVKEIKIVKGIQAKVTFDSENYYLTLTHFREYAESFSLKVEISSGSSLKTVSLEKTTVFYDLAITPKESGQNYVIVWVEKKE